MAQRYADTHGKYWREYISPSPKPLSRVPCGFKYKLQVRLKLPRYLFCCPHLEAPHPSPVEGRALCPEDALTGETSADASYTRSASELTDQYLSFIFFQYIFKGRWGVRKPRFGYQFHLHYFVAFGQATEFFFLI